jgi:O-antigen/teichoic acid export membrane protein
MNSKGLRGIVKGTFWVILATVVTRFAGFIALPLLARLLSPSGLGLYNIIQSTVQTGDGLSRIGVDAAIHRNGSQYKTTGAKAVGRLFGVGTCLLIGTGSLIAISLWLFREALAIHWLGEAKVEPWLGLTAVIIFFTVIGNPSWFYLVALHDFRTYSLRTSVISITGAGLTVSLAWFFGFVGAIWGLVLTAIIQATWGWWLTLPILKKNAIELRYDNFFHEARDILSFGLPFYASNFLSSFVALPLLGYVSRTGGIEQLGYLRVAQSLSQFISFLPTAIAPVLISNLSASYATDATDFKTLKSLHLRSLWAVILIITVTISSTLEILVPMLFGSTYTQAIFLSRLTIWIAAVQSLSGMLSQYLISAGKTRVIAVVQTLGLFINIVAALFFIPLYSSVGLLLAQSLAVLLTFTGYIRPALIDLDRSDKKCLWLLAGLSFSLVPITFILPLVCKNIFMIIVSLVSVTIITILLALNVAFTMEEKSLLRMSIKKIIGKY